MIPMKARKPSLAAERRGILIPAGRGRLDVIGLSPVRGFAPPGGRGITSPAAGHSPCGRRQSVSWTRVLDGHVTRQQALLAGGHQRDHRRGSTRAVSVRCRAGLRSPSTGSRRRVAAWRREPPFRTAAPREGKPGGAGLDERKAGGTAPHGGEAGAPNPGSRASQRETRRSPGSTVPAVCRRPRPWTPARGDPAGARSWDDTCREFEVTGPPHAAARPRACRRRRPSPAATPRPPGARSAC